MIEITMSEIARLHDEKQIHIHQNLNEFQAWLNLLRQQEPRVYLEIGAYKLGSAQLALETLPTLQMLVTIDSTDLHQDATLDQKLRDYQDHLQFVCGKSGCLSTLATVESLLNGRTIDALFIDGDHSYNGVMKDYCYYAPLVTPGRGYVGFHDVQMENMPGGFQSRGHLGTQLFWNGLERSYPNRCQLMEGDPGPWGNYGIGVYNVVHPGNG